VIVVSEKLYKIILHFSIFIFLVLMTSIALRLTGSDRQNLSAEIDTLNVVPFFVAVMIVIVISTNNFWNLLLPDLKLKTLIYRY